MELHSSNWKWYLSKTCSNSLGRLTFYTPRSLAKANNVLLMLSYKWDGILVFKLIQLNSIWFQNVLPWRLIKVHETILAWLKAAWNTFRFVSNLLNLISGNLEQFCWPIYLIKLSNYLLMRLTRASLLLKHSRLYFPLPCWQCHVLSSWKRGNRKFLGCYRTSGSIHVIAAFNTANMNADW